MRVITDFENDISIGNCSSHFDVNFLHSIIFKLLHKGSLFKSLPYLVYIHLTPRHRNILLFNNDFNEYKKVVSSGAYTNWLTIIFKYRVLCR